MSIKKESAADEFLYDVNVGGYRLNSDFRELKTNLGRMFGFAFGHKENGAVFVHMVVMYETRYISADINKKGKRLWRLYGTIA